MTTPLLFNRRARSPRSPRVVLITSILHRKKTLELLLAALATQTEMPDMILLRLDGYGETDASPAIPDAILSRLVIWTDEDRGAGRRWYHPALRTLRSDAIVLTIDDDLIPHSRYVEITAGLVENENAAIGWHGWQNERTANELGAYFTAPQHPLRVVTLGAGVAAYRWVWVKSMLDRPLARPCLLEGPQADDDALLSLHLWLRGTTMIRPAGKPPITETATSRGPGASFLLHAPYRHGQRLALAIAYDWPALEPVFPCPHFDAMRRATPTSSPEEGFMSVMQVFSEQHGGDMQRPHLLRWTNAMRETGAKRGAAYMNAILPRLEALPEAASVLVVGLGRWTIWMAMLLSARFGRLVTLTKNIEHAAVLPKILGHAVRSVESYAVPPDDVARFDLVIATTHRSEQELAWVRARPDHLILTEGMETC